MAREIQTFLQGRYQNQKQWDHVSTQKLLEAVRLQLIKQLFWSERKIDLNAYVFSAASMCAWQFCCLNSMRENWPFALVCPWFVDSTVKVWLLCRMLSSICLNSSPVNVQFLLKMLHLNPSHVLYTGWKFTKLMVLAKDEGLQHFAPSKDYTNTSVLFSNPVSCL